MRLPAPSVIVAIIALAASPAAAQSSFRGLGFIDGPGSASTSVAQGVSADGSVVVGQNISPSNETQAFRWTGAGMSGLGFLGGATLFSIAQAVSADGSVVVGVTSDPLDQARAFRWTTGGGMVGLGALGNPISSSSWAYGVSADGSVVVGLSQNALGRNEAFRWTQATNMVGLGFLGPLRPNPSSIAFGLSADGLVVVGNSENAGGQGEAFRWTPSTNMVGLGIAPGYAASIATATNRDGSVVVGANTQNFPGAEQAFRWTSGGMVSLGYIPGGAGGSSWANAVSGDGAIVVGRSSSADFAVEAFRWTQGSGMQSLRGLLTAAGVNLGPWFLLDATAISANGQFIAGVGVDPDGRNQAYLVRYVDPSNAMPPITDGSTVPAPAGPVIAGLTTLGAVQQSLDRLAATRQGMMAQQHGFAAPLLGANLPIGSGTEAGIFVSAGSLESGGFGRIAFGNGLTLLGGLAYQHSEYRRSEVARAGLGALALRYVFDPVLGLTPFVEAGGWTTTNAEFKFKRPYANGFGQSQGHGESSGTLSYLYGRFGLSVSPTARDEIAVSAEFGREQLHVKGYAEPLVLGNPFEARVLPGSDRLDVVKVRAQWNRAFTEVIDGSLYVAGVRAIGQDNDVWASVAGFGLLRGEAARRAHWLEAGARLGYRLTANLSLDVFADGIAGRDAIGTRIHSGAALRWRF